MIMYEDPFWELLTMSIVFAMLVIMIFAVIHTAIMFAIKLVNIRRGNYNTKLYYSKFKNLE